MPQLFLTSASDYVISDIVTKLPKSPGNYNVAFINTASEVEAGVLRDWDMSPKNIDKVKSNIIWENLPKFHVPSEITKYEKARVKAEKKRGEYLPRQ